MKYISLSKLQKIIPEFVDNRLMPSAPSHIKWLLGGSTFLALHKTGDLIEKYSPLLKSLGILSEDNKIILDTVEPFINNAFSKSGKVEYFGFTFDKADGEYLIELLKENVDE